jgi:iron complex outermembrane receptor protein
MYNYMTGVKRNGNTGYDLNIRGFKTSGKRSQRDHGRRPAWPGVRFGSPPTIGVEHVEVVKGPASVLYGNAQPGGFVNMTSKKPKSAWAGTVELRGTATRARGSMRAMHRLRRRHRCHGTVRREGQFLGRLVAQKIDKDTFAPMPTTRAPMSPRASPGTSVTRRPSLPGWSSANRPRPTTPIS